jgi:cysteine desulfurase/selenocysteine lyase
MTAASSVQPTVLDPLRLREEFPILWQEVHGKPLVYLDNAATSQKPRAVIEAISAYYELDNANVHRGVHTLSERATASYEGARKKVAAFLGTEDAREIVFTRGTTEAVNLVANTWGQQNIGDGDEILITEMEHHSNIVPWQMLAERTGAKVVVAPIGDDGALLLDEFKARLSSRTKLVACVHVSNALGTVNPVAEMTRLAHEVGALILVDGAQAVPHTRVDVKASDFDFYAFSAHKAYGPTGIGALYAKAALLESMPPWQGGGEMILSVTFDKTIYNEIPHKFEAGTPSIAAAAGLGAAIDWMQGVGLEAIAAHEALLLDYATEKLAGIPGLKMIGTAPEKAGVASFVIDGVHPHDLGTVLDHDGVAIRTGHHCAQPVMARFKIPATARASFAAYNTTAEIDILVAALAAAREMFV